MRCELCEAINKLMDLKRLIGSEGESAAARYLKRRGYTLVGQNYSCRFGEIDLIARKDGYIVFVEVKTRKDESFATAREFVTPAKQERVRKTAMLWLQQNDVDLQPRFDVIEVVGQGRRQTIRHMENAF